MKTSCLIPCHNAYPHLLQCLRSLVKQFDEVVVYFDASTDGSYAQVEFLCEDNPHLRLLSGQDNIGVQQSRNLLYEYSTGDLICFFDADDFREKDSVIELASRFSCLPSDFGCIITPYYYWVRDPLYRSETYRKYTSYWMEEFHDVVPSVWELLAKREIQTGGMFWKRECLESIRMEKGSVWDSQRIALQDGGLILDAMECGWQIDVFPLLTHTYRWGWSSNQITIARNLEYLDHVVRFLERLEGCCRNEYQTLTTTKKLEIQKIREQLAYDYEHHFLSESIEPCFD